MRQRAVRHKRKTEPLATLFLDPTDDNELLLGFIIGSRTLHRRVTVPRGHHEHVLRAIESFFVSANVQPTWLGELIVVDGPGRFSSLRIAAVIANTIAWAHNVRLSSIHRSEKAWQGDRAFLEFVKKNAHRVLRIEPFYGKPPSITHPR